MPPTFLLVQVLFSPGRAKREPAQAGVKTKIVLAQGFGGVSAEKVGEFSRIALSMTDAQATYETLRDRGVVFREPPTMQPWGMIQALFENQDGNRYVLVGA
jgi:hypothetical protein